MALSSEKLDVASAISIITSLTNDSSDDIFGLINNNTFSAFANNDDNAVDFIINIITLVAGADYLKNVINDLVKNLVSKIEEPLKSTFKSQSETFNNNKPVSPSFFTNGFDIPIAALDKFNLFNSSFQNDYTYGSNTNNLNYKLKSVLAQPNISHAYNSISFQFNPSSKNINIKPLSDSITYKDLIFSIIDGDEFIDTKKIITEILDLLFGILSSKKNMTESQLYNSQLINEISKKLVKNDNLDNETVFELSKEELIGIENKVKNRLNNTFGIDVDCSILNSEFVFEDAIEAIESEDFANSFENLIDNSFSVEAPLTETDDVSPTVKKVNKNNEKKNSSLKDKSKFKESVYKDFINGFIEIIINNTIFSPKAELIINLINYIKNPNILFVENIENKLQSLNSLKNNLPQITDVNSINGLITLLNNSKDLYNSPYNQKIDDLINELNVAKNSSINGFINSNNLLPILSKVSIIIAGLVVVTGIIASIKNRKNLIKCIVKQVKDQIIDFLYQILKDQLLKLIKPLLKKIIQEQIEDYASIYKGLLINR